MREKTMTKNIKKYRQEVDFAKRVLPRFFDRILWQYGGGGGDGLCSFNTCRKKLRYDEETIKIRDSSTDLVAIFHVRCYQSMLKPPPGNLPLQGKLKDMDSKDILWKKNVPDDESDWYCSLHSCQKLISHDEKNIVIVDEDAGNKKRFAVFHVDCFASLLEQHNQALPF